MTLTPTLSPSDGEREKAATVKFTGSQRKIPFGQMFPRAERETIVQSQGEQIRWLVIEAMEEFERLPRLGVRWRHQRPGAFFQSRRATGPVFWDDEPSGIALVSATQVPIAPIRP